MKTPTLQQTSEYDLFLPHDHQQPMSDDHVINLAESIQRHGYLPSKPIQCYLGDDKKLHIIDGHHRLKAAELADSFVYYVIEPKENADLIGVENVLVKKWRNSSFVSMYAEKGNEDYQKLQRYMGRGIPLDLLANLLAGNISGKAQNYELRSGLFKVKTVDSVTFILRIFDRLGESCPNLKTNNYAAAFAVLRRIPEFNIEHFYARALANPRALVKAATRDQAIETIEEVYNYRSRVDHVPLALMAKEVLRKIAVEQGYKNVGNLKSARKFQQTQPERTA